MRRFAKIFISALAVLMAGCSRDVEVVTVQENDWVVNLDLPVPIRLGIGGITKAAITDDSLADEMFGLFAVAEETEDFMASDGLNLDNQPARYTGDGFSFLDEHGNPVMWYYPMSSDQRYLFYGYCVNGAEPADFPVKISSDMITVAVPVTTHSDILCGKTSVSSNASSMRETRNPSYAIDFTFRHVTACLSFKAIMDGASEWPEGKELHVSSLVLNNVPSEAELCLVDRSSSDDLWSGSYFIVPEVEGNEVSFDGPGTAVSTNVVSICDDIYIVPQSERLIVRVTGTFGDEPFDIDLTEKVAGLNGHFGYEGYSAGLRYKYKILFVYSDVEGVTVKVASDVS